ncbi:MAG: cytochrome ubiquinol oxidase subunit I [Candidatus Omnitrophica bacterium]|nr:cytochrome ubiquinol oxidase subunit I [Candidatus Omnitrophota bacterium]
MSLVLLSRIQFALTIAFHYIFPPLSIGLGLLMVFMEGAYLKTRRPVYHQMARFWTKIFGLTFSIGVASGIVMEFQFGTNWAAYSRYVGDVFGSALAAEGIFAFFLESGFLAVLLFGWNRVGPKMHFFATCMVALGSMFSAIWIVVANSWMQTPAGFRIVGEGAAARAEITDFWALVFNPSSLDRLSHVLSGCWQAGGWLVLSVSAFYLLQRKHEEFAKASIRIALVFVTAASLFQLFTGHQSAVTISRYQPAKLAAFEGHYPESAPASMHLAGWVDEREEKVRSFGEWPNLLSFLVHGDFSKPVKGLRAFPPDERPPVQWVFQAYHAMIWIGIALIGLSLTGMFFWWRGKLFETRWLLRLFVIAVLGPQFANQLGWMAAEIGRQPWIVYGILRTEQGVSRSVGSGEVAASIVMFSVVYFLLFVLFIFLLDQKIRKGPEEELAAAAPRRASYRDS